MAQISAWIESFRLRTLPLSLSTIILGSFLAAYHQKFSWPILVWAVLTTLFLQTLSNLANDYGDAEHGVDNHERIGPKRGLQAGAISPEQMKKAIIVFIILSLISGIILIIEGTRGLKLSFGLFFFILGIAAIIAAMKYTMGRNPYGYAGLGDVFVFVFFGLVGVIGTCFLHTHSFMLPELLPAVTMGCFSAGVLNLNNLRDRENDKASGKHTLVVKLGSRKARIYHALLLSIGMLTAVFYVVMQQTASGWKWLFLLSFAGIVRSILKVLRIKEVSTLDPELKYLSLSTLLFALLFGAGLLL